MEIAVVYESMFGTTHEVADAIAQGVTAAAPEAHVQCLSVGDADPDQVAAADLLVVGGPTHMHGMTSGMSRKMAVQMEEKRENSPEGPIGHGLEPGAEGEGLRNWFHRLPKHGKGRRAAAFDTRAEGPMMGGAARGIEHRLSGHGYEMVADPEGFLVEGDRMLLKAGEQGRARAWGAALVHQLAAAGR